MIRIRNKVKPEIANEQCGFVEGKGTKNAVIIIVSIIARALQVQKEIHIYLRTIDIHVVRYDEIVTQVTQLNIHVDENDRGVIKNMQALLS